MYYNIMSPPASAGHAFEALMFQTDAVMSRLLHELQEASGTHHSEWQKAMFNRYESGGMFLCQKLVARILDSVESVLRAKGTEIDESALKFTEEKKFIECRRTEWMLYALGMVRVIQPFSQKLLDSYGVRV